MTNNIVKLNIGGTIFHTSEFTLKQHTGFLNTMLTTGMKSSIDDSGATFIDRDPTHFQRILNYMRHGKIDFPESAEIVQAIRDEADFYSLVDLVKLCDERLPTFRLRHIKSNQELLEIITEPKKTVLIISYPIAPCGFVNPIDISTIQLIIEPYKVKLDLYFKAIHVDGEEPVLDQSKWGWLLRKGTNSFQSLAGSNYLQSLEKVLGIFISDGFLTVDPPSCTLSDDQEMYTHTLTNHTGERILIEEIELSCDNLESVLTRSKRIIPASGSIEIKFRSRAPGPRSGECVITFGIHEYRASGLTIKLPITHS